MSRRQLIKNIIAGTNNDRCGSWIGNPDTEALPLYLKASGTHSLDELQQQLLTRHPEFIKTAEELRERVTAATQK